MYFLNKLSHYRSRTWLRFIGRCFSGSSTTPQSVLITTPIFYVNSVPHIGHLYSAILADTLSRWHKLKGRYVIFSTGTDEHGLKIQQAAAKNNVQPRELCDTNAAHFKKLFDLAHVDYTDFIRTTDDRHSVAVNHLWSKLKEGGYIYKGTYEGWYCTSDETFLPDIAITEVQMPHEAGAIKVSKESGHPVEWVKEENYMFRLSEFGEPLRKWLNKGVIHPALPYLKEVEQLVEKGLPDLSISRTTERLSWGIPVPDDDSQTMYVWLDALTNYLTVCGYPTEKFVWPSSTYHLVGKDIIKFHAVYWPAFLMAAGLEPPSAILCHGHLLKDHRKMSKSIGNVVDPFRSIERYTPDGLRFYLLFMGVPHSDANFDEESIVDVINNGLADTLGNLILRCRGQKMNPKQVIPPFDKAEFDQRASEEDKQMWSNLTTLKDKVNSHFEDFRIYHALEDIMAQIRDTNGFITRHEPWHIISDDKNAAWVDTILHVCLHTCRICGILLQPAVPNFAEKVLRQLNVSLSDRTWEHAKITSEDEVREITLGPKEIIMTKLSHES